MTSEAVTSAAVYQRPAYQRSWPRQVGRAGSRSRCVGAIKTATQWPAKN